jgi:hypothetical protein
MAIQAQRLSNTRPSKGGQGSAIQFCTLTTAGSMAINQTAMNLVGLKLDDAALIEVFNVEDVNLAPTFQNGDKVFVFTKGYQAKEKGEKSVGSRISDTNGKNVISLATFYKELGGNNNERLNFSFSDPIYGFLEGTDGTVTPIEQDTPNDAGTVSAYVRSEHTTELGKKVVKIELTETEWTVEEAKANATPMFALQFENAQAKVIRNKATNAATTGTAKAGKATKSQTVDTDFDADEDFEEA